MFFLTPIFWMAGQAGRRTAFVTGNPFNALIDLVRVPIIDGTYQSNMMTTLGLTFIIITILAIMSTTLTRKKLYNWL